MSIDTERIRKSTRRVRTFVKRNAKRPRSHDVLRLRTSARRLETALVALGLDADRLRDLEKTRRLAGKLRDMDVLTAHALNVDRRGELDCLVRLLEHLGAERSKRARKLHAAIAKRRPRILRWLVRVEKAAADVRGNGGDRAVRGAMARAIQVSSRLSRPGRLTRSNLHAYRSRVKELRDLLRLSDRRVDSALVPKLVEVKDAIGDWHDWVELAEIAAGTLDHGASCRLVKRIAATRDARYRNALSVARALVTRLRPRRRKRRAPIAKPVLEAVAAIAEGTPQG
jgi:CHAD domain-containing protein